MTYQQAYNLVQNRPPDDPTGQRNSNTDSIIHQHPTLHSPTQILIYRFLSTLYSSQSPGWSSWSARSERAVGAVAKRFEITHCVWTGVEGVANGQWFFGPIPRCRRGIEVQIDGRRRAGGGAWKRTNGSAQHDRRAHGPCQLHRRPHHRSKQPRGAFATYPPPSHHRKTEKHQRTRYPAGLNFHLQQQRPGGTTTTSAVVS